MACYHMAHQNPANRMQDPHWLLSEDTDGRRLISVYVDREQKAG